MVFKLKTLTDGRLLSALQSGALRRGALIQRFPSSHTHPLIAFDHSSLYIQKQLSRALILITSIASTILFFIQWKPMWDWVESEYIWDIRHSQLVPNPVYKQTKRQFKEWHFSSQSQAGAVQTRSPYMGKVNWMHLFSKQPDSQDWLHLSRNSDTWWSPGAEKLFGYFCNLAFMWLQQSRRT